MRTVMELAIACAFIAPMAGCAEEDAAPPSRCADVLDDGSDDPGETGPFDDPLDFDRGGCEPGALDDVDVCGIWHLDLALEGYQGPGAVRVDLSGGEGASDLEGLLFGREVSDVRMTGDDLFLRHVELDQEGTPIVRAIDACEVRDDGQLVGTYVRCAADECFGGSFVATKVEPLDEPIADGMTLVSEWNGPPDAPWSEDGITLNVRHQGDVAYVARGIDGLRIVDLADPARPLDLGHAPPLYPEVYEFYNDVKIVTAGDATFAFAASSVRGAVAIDVSDPALPIEVTTFPPPPIEGGGIEVHTLFVDGDRLYLANTTVGGIDVYDIAQPAGPVRIGGYIHPEVAVTGGFVHDLYVEDARAYLDYWNLGMVVVDLIDPANPLLVGTFDDYQRRTSHSSWVTSAGGRRVAVHGDEDFDAHVRIVDTEDLSEIGSYQTREAVSVHNIMASDERAFVTYYQDGLRVLDLSDPTEPAAIAHYLTWPGPEPGYGRGFYEGAIGVDLDAERALVLLADTHRGLLVLTLDR